jgi:hypothetical protein
MEVYASDETGSGSYLYAETVTPGPSSIETTYGGADSVEMNLAAGTYSISGESGASIQFYGGTFGNVFDESVSGGAELVIDAVGPAPTPEPATLTLLSTGVFGLCGCRLWRKRRAA